MLKTKENIDLIWDHTHKEQRTIINGEKFVMRNAPKWGLGTIDGMSDEEFSEHLERAKLRHKKSVIAEEINAVCEKHGCVDHFNSSRQWRDSLQDVRTFFSWALGESELNAFMADIETNVKF